MTTYTHGPEATPLIEDGEFIFLENGTWGGLQLDYTRLSNVSGQAIDDGNIADATTKGGQFHNFIVVNGGIYDIKLVIDAAAYTKVVTIANTQ